MLENKGEPKGMNAVRVLRNIFLLSVGLTVGLLAPIALGDDYSQNFETWPTTTSYVNSTNQNWVANDTRIVPDGTFGYGNAASPTNAAFLNALSLGGTPWITSPPLTNGMGSITVATRCKGAAPQVFVVETSTDGNNWTTNGVVTNTVLSTAVWTTNTVAVNAYSSLQVRMRKIADGGSSTHQLGVDNITISLPPSFVVISNVTLSPSPQVVSSNVHVSAKIQPSLGASNLIASVFYRTNSTPTFSSVSMSTTGSNFYATDGIGIPALSVPGMAAQYYVRVVFDGSTPGKVTNYYPSAAPGTPDSYRVRAVSGYTNMVVAGAQVTDMFLFADYQWQGVIAPTGTLVNPSFGFASGPTAWGDHNPSGTTIPISGNAAFGEGNVPIAASLTNPIAFQFNETNNFYTIQNCAYVNFDGWTNGTTTSYKTYTNSAGWIISGARINASDETDHAFVGNFAILQNGKPSPGDLQYVKSPCLTNGIGTVSFWHRPWSTDGTPYAGFLIQKSYDGTNNWATIPGAIVSTNKSLGYVYFSASVGDRSNQYVRILNTNSGAATSYLCVDEIAVTEPGATVSLENPQRSTANPAARNPVDVSIDAVPNGGATNLDCRVYFRPTNSVEFSYVTLTNSGNTFSGSIPPAPAGRMDYYFRCAFDGFSAAPAYYPGNAPAGFLSYTNTDALASDRSQNFDAWAFTTTYINTTNSDGWIAEDTLIAKDTVYGYSKAASSPNAGWLNALNLGGTPFVQSPLLSNGIGTVYLASRSKATGFNIFVVETSPDAASWVTNVVFTNSSRDAWATNVAPINIIADSYVRIRKIDDNNQGGQFLGLDNIVITYPAADALISNVRFSPGYPSSNETVIISCNVSSAFTNIPVYNIAPTVWHRMSESPWTASPMSLQATNRYAGTIPAYPPGQVEYYIRCLFDGYRYTASESQSPAYSPDAVASAARPSTFHTYDVRRFMSDYGSMIVTSALGNAEMALIGNNTWQGVLTVPIATNRLTVSFSGLDRFVDSDYSTNVSSWGDATPSRTTLPLSGAGESDGPAMTINAAFDGTNQVVFRYNVEDNSYSISRCVFQDFNSWQASTEYFDESVGQGTLAKAAETFNAWPLNQLYYTRAGYDSATFNDWAPGVYPDVTYGQSYPAPNGTEGWYIQQAAILQQVAAAGTSNGACALDNGGKVWMSRTFLTDGLQELRFDYRARYDDNAYTYYTNGFAWNNYQIEATLQADQMAPDLPYFSIFARYLDSNNKYEYRLGRAENQAYLLLSLWRHRVGVASQIGSTAYISRTLNVANLCKFVVITNNSGSVYLEGWLNGGLYLYGVTSYDTTSDRINGPGTIGFHTRGADMSVDDISVRSMDIQRFENWSGASAYGTWSNNAWTVVDGSVLTSYCTLNSNLSATVTSPVFPFPIGVLQFSVHKWTGASDWQAKVQCSTNGLTPWITIDTITGVPFGWSQKTYTTNQLANYRAFRIMNSSTGSLVGVQDIRITASNTLYSESFTTASSNWFAPSGAWSVSAGSYQRDGYIGPRVGFAVERALTNGVTDDAGPVSDWSNVVSIASSNLTYTSTNITLRSWEGLFVRIRNTNSTARLVVDNISMSSWRGSDIFSNGWAATETWGTEGAVPSPSNHLAFWRSKANPAVVQGLRTPYMTNGISTFSFDYMVANPPAEFVIQRAVAPSTNSFTDVATVTVSNSAWAHYTVSIKTNTPMYVRVNHTSPNNSAVLYIDNAEAVDYAEANTATWKAYNALITPSQDVREFQTNATFRTCYLNNLPSGSNPGTDGGRVFAADLPYIQSARLPSGIGEISFFLRDWQTNGVPSAKIYLKISPMADAPASDWMTVATLQGISNTVYGYFTTNIYEKTNYYLRIYGDTNGSARFCLDNVLVTEPVGADFDITAVRTIPEVPLYTDNVKLSADLANFVLNPTNIQVRAYYHVGSNAWGNWPTNDWIDLDEVMTNGSVVQYRSSAGIPAQGIDTAVQYFVSCTFGGMFAEKASPKNHKQFTNPSWYYPVDLNAGQANTNPYYVVFSCSTGVVWINEINVTDFTLVTTQYVELCGLTGVNISNWWLDVYDSTPELQGLYPITNHAVLANQTNGYGFWLLGANSLPNRDMTLTNGLPIPAGGVRLLRSFGAIEHAISYETYTGAGGPEMQGDAYHFIYAGYDNDLANTVLSLSGSGSNRYAFSWVNNTKHTPGRTNVNQTLLVYHNTPPPLIDITGFWLTDTNVYLVFTGTNDMGPTPWYATNLVGITPWYAVTNYTTLPYTDGVYTQWFALMTNAPAAFYKIVATNAPAP